MGRANAWTVNGSGRAGQKWRDCRRQNRFPRRAGCFSRRSGARSLPSEEDPKSEPHGDPHRMGIGDRGSAGTALLLGRRNPIGLAMRTAGDRCTAAGRFQFMDRKVSLLVPPAIQSWRTFA